MNQDEQQLQLLSVFHYVCAGIVALFACMPLIHLFFGLMMLFHPQSFGGGKEQVPEFVGWMFVTAGSAAILIGWTMAAVLAWAGRCLNRRVHYTFCCIAAGVACMFMPFGTVLGVFSLIVLMRPSVKALFDAPAKPPVAA
jgi:hypothetical protein